MGDISHSRVVRSNIELLHKMGAKLTIFGCSTMTCVEYECNQGDHTFFGTPDNTMYRSYQPYRTLNRL